MSVQCMKSHQPTDFSVCVVLQWLLGKYSQSESDLYLYPFHQLIVNMSELTDTVGSSIHYRLLLKSEAGLKSHSGAHFLYRLWNMKDTIMALAWALSPCFGEVFWLCALNAGAIVEKRNDLFCDKKFWVYLCHLI